MNQGTIRLIFRWIHIVFSIPILGYIYSPFDQIPNYPRLLGLSSFLYLSSLDFGCGKPCPSTTGFEEIAQSKYWHENRTRTGGIKIQ
jgi:hypothetical protein